MIKQDAIIEESIMIRNNSVKKVDRLASFKDLLGDQKVFNRKKSRELLG